MRRLLVVVGCLLAACGSDDPAPVAHDTPPVVTTSAPAPSFSPTATPAPSASPTSRPTTAARRAATRTPSRTPSYIVAPPPESEPFTAPTFVSAKLGGCDDLGGNQWRIRFAVTVRGGENWQFDDAPSTTVPYFTHAGTTYGSGGTATGTFHLGMFSEDDFDETIIWYAIRNEPQSKRIAVRLPAKYELHAHCAR